MDAPPRLLASEGRRRKAEQMGVVALLLAAAAVVNPDHPLPFDLCAFKYLTGLPCPTCGLTRALCHAVRFEWAQSPAYHPAGILLALALAGWLIWSAVEMWRGQLVGETVRRRLSTACVGAGGSVSVAVWIIRLAAGVRAI